MNPNRSDAIERAHTFSQLAKNKGFDIYCLHPDLLPGSKAFNKLEPADWQNEKSSQYNFEIAVVFGGDGTILRAADSLYGSKIPIVGINLGNVGFLAEIAEPKLDQLLDAVIAGQYKLEPRATLEYFLDRAGKVISHGWAINEVTVERSNSQMMELFLSIDGKPVSRWGCDSVIFSSPTGSTAYAFSAGGPVIWPEVEALLITPVANHGLFSRSMVISNQSQASIDIESQAAGLVADGVRNTQLQQGDRIEMKLSTTKIYLAHFDNSVFTDRLVAKFRLPISGWRR